LPKWYYTIPYVGFWKIFEMPFLGYFGYPFFGLAIYSYIAIVFSMLLSSDISAYFYGVEKSRRQPVHESVQRVRNRRN
jgi:hypothetical protein